MPLDDELARWREWPGPREEPEGAGEPWADDEDRAAAELARRRAARGELDEGAPDRRHGRHARGDDDS
jgi:hypothetical protein